MVKDYSESKGEKHTAATTWATLFNSQQEFFYMHIREGRMHLTHFIYVIWWRITWKGKEETHCHHFIGYSFWLAARYLLYAPSYIPQPLLHQIVEHWFEEVLAQWVHHEESIWWPIALWVDALQWTYRDFSNTFTYIHLLMYLIIFY